jgi:hypothetical protein
MPIVHAYRRTVRQHVKPVHVVDLAAHGKFEFKPNDKGEFVAEVPAGPALNRLLAISEAYRIHGAPVVADDDDEDEGDASPYVITDGDKTVDLRALDKAALLQFAAENDIAIHPNAKDETIRDRLVKALTKGE